MKRGLRKKGKKTKHTSLTATGYVAFHRYGIIHRSMVKKCIWCSDQLYFNGLTGKRLPDVQASLDTLLFATEQ